MLRTKKNSKVRKFILLNTYQRPAASPLVFFYFKIKNGDLSIIKGLNITYIPQKGDDVMGRKGRKERYSTHVQPFLQEIARWKTTMTEEQIADRLGIAYSTFQKYKVDHDELNQVCMFGDRQNINDIYSSLLKKAKGYDYETTKDVLDKYGTVHTLKTTHHQPMSEKAAEIYIKNHTRDYHTADTEEIENRRREIKLKEQKADDEKWD